MNLGFDCACFPGDETGSKAMSEAIQHYHVFETAMGFCAIAWSDAGVARFQLPTKTAEAAERMMRRRAVGAEPGAPPEDIAAVIEAAKTVLRRRGRSTSRGFQSISQTRTRSSPRFTTRCVGSAGEARPPMARWRRRSARAAKGRVTSARRWPKIRCRLIIPCHRVLAAGGKIGGFSAPGGSKTKARMLELEGVRVGPPEVAQQSFGF